MKMLSAPVDFPCEETVMWNFDVLFVVNQNKLLKKNSWVAGDLKCYDAHVTSL